MFKKFVIKLLALKFHRIPKNFLFKVSLEFSKNLDALKQQFIKVSDIMSSSKPHQDFLFVNLFRMSLGFS
jgi:hypothetical protein